MRRKPLVVSLSPLGMSLQEERMLTTHGCVFAYRDNLCFVTCPAGTTRKRHGSRDVEYGITFPNGTRVRQRYWRTWRIGGLAFGVRRTAYLSTTEENI